MLYPKKYTFLTKNGNSKEKDLNYLQKFLPSRNLVLKFHKASRLKITETTLKSITYFNGKTFASLTNIFR